MEGIKVRGVLDKWETGVHGLFTLEEELEVGLVGNSIVLWTINLHHTRRLPLWL